MSDDFDPLSHLKQAYLPAIEAELKQAVTSIKARGEESLYDMLSYHMGWQVDESGQEVRGKRIRPLLLLLTISAAGGPWMVGLPAASAVELVHNFSLIHDDIEDNSPLRHGRPTLWKLWGIPQAINAGDAMFSLAHLEIMRIEKSTSAEIAFQAVRMLLSTCLHLTQGQHLDLHYENRNDLTETDYWQMISGKTAALISTCTHLGSLIAGASSERQEQYGEFGRLLGLAFQVQDDLLGIWGDAALTGKSTQSDLVTRKKTLPVLYGLSKRSAFAKRWETGTIQVEDIAEITHLLEAEGGRTYTEQLANQLTQQAIDSLEATQPDGIAGIALRQLTNQLLARTA